MFFLVWFMFTNNKIDYYQLGQFPTESACKEALEEAKVLITSSTKSVLCFEVVPE
tara:strand:+ start:465 stop:629 length:165 start_codon:yes stop_codon:yes gene_type:complete